MRNNIDRIVRKHLRNVLMEAVLGAQNQPVQQPGQKPGIQQQAAQKQAAGQQQAKPAASFGVNKQVAQMGDKGANLASNNSTNLGNDLSNSLNAFQGKLNQTKTQNNGAENEKLLPSNRTWQQLKSELNRIISLMGNIEGKTGGDVSDVNGFGTVSNALMSCTKQCQIGITQGQQEQKKKGGYQQQASAQAQRNSQINTQQAGVNKANQADNNM